MRRGRRGLETGERVRGREEERRRDKGRVGMRRIRGKGRKIGKLKMEGERGTGRGGALNVNK
jgi:hypothetical protein